MAYTPPAGDAVNFTFSGGYTAPQGDDVDLLFGAVGLITLNASSSFVTPEVGFDTLTLRWTSTESGPFRVELGGTSATTGDLLKSGRCVAGKEVTNVITSEDITGAPSYTGYASYRINVYVLSVDDIWTPFG